ncbi:MAG: MATE family efflux transporter [Pseudoruegeria sp.]
MSHTPKNSFLTGSLGGLYAKTALPIIFVMGMNGLIAVADALFLGHYVGPEALGAVTLMFPIYMLIVALATLVAGGMSSLLARHLGAGDSLSAQSVFAGAHGLGFTLGLGMIGLFFAFGMQATQVIGAGSAELANLGQIYLRITVLFSPLMFILSVNSDALRNEGRVGLMALMSLLVSVANIAFNFVLIALMEMGVAGAAIGSGLAQLLAFAIILCFRIWGTTELRSVSLIRQSLFAHWGRIIALGAPPSLSFIGLSLGSAAIIVALQMVQSDQYENTIIAYGIMTRVMTFVFMPFLGLSHAMQTIIGNNYGAQLWARCDQGLRIALGLSFFYCLCVQIALTLFGAQVGGMFVKDPDVSVEVARIFPLILMLFFVSGPMMMLSSYFQAIGDAGRAAIIGLAKPYIFGIPLTFILMRFSGEVGIWLASPISELCLIGVTVLVLFQRKRQTNFRLGVFHPTAMH